ncbi:MAG: branched-chain amino acid ABC transporter permease [Firmicutes bacterium]|nr:branched-chain amino acid ABC transporter permease [Alicyclobacillaceae bacterium]MCL6496227.1 branched-chain amino acid ABC transporter permease [Bacillota bacterium]
MTWRAIQRRDQSDVEDRPPAPAAATGGARALWVRVALPLFGIAAALAIPLGLNQSNLTVYITMCLYAVITIGLSLLMGFAGQISAGQAAFMAIGAYTAALLSLHGWPPLLAFLAAPVVSGLFAALIGIPVLRMRANYLAFATMAIQLMLVALLSNIPALGGSTGLVSIPNFGIGSWQIQSLRGYAWLSVAVAVIILFLSRNLIASRPGRALRALATSEVAAESVGVHVMRFKVVVFAISAAYAGLAGAIYAFFMGAITPDGFSLLLSLEFLVMVIVGGLGTLAGPLVGTALLVILNQVLNTLGTQPGMPAYMPEVLSYAVYGCTLVVVLIAFPHGLVPFFSGQFRRWFGRQQQAPTAKPVPGAPVDVEPQRQSWG